MKRSLLYIGNKLSKKGSTVTSIETLGNFLKDEGFSVKTASSQKSKVLRLLDMLWAVIRFPKKNTVVLIDTYSTQNFFYAVAVAKTCRLFSLPYIPILRGGNLPVRLDRSPKLSEQLFNNAEVSVAPSHYLMEAFTARGYTNLVYIPNTIQIDKYVFIQRKKVEAKLLWVRSFSNIYNPLLALEILRQLNAKGVSASLTMVGPQKDESYMRCKAEAERDQLKVEFTGKLSKEAWIARAAKHDIFINTTNFDNTPVSVMEAMALGMPVISTNVGGLPFLITHDEDGILVPPEQAEPFVAAILDLMKNPDKVERITTNARQKVARFDWSLVKAQWISLLSE
ncbi:MAG: glycosyltransferase family 4 protein [Marinirhabdus sp.]|nr:glycosyltransferase family 4 protein [Marinirhabdus sp.]